MPTPSPNPSPSAPNVPFQPEADRVLRIVRRFKAPRERVFKAWTDPQQLAQWLGPEEMALPVFKADVRVGGEWQTTMKGPPGEHHVSGKYLVIEPPRRLIFTWAWHERPRHETVREHETICIVELSEQGGETEMVFEQRLFRNVDGRDNHNKGWTSTFNGLARYLETGKGLNRG